MRTYVNSDAIIHECGSFTAENLYSDKPSCYMLIDNDEVVKTFFACGAEVFVSILFCI